MNGKLCQRGGMEEEVRETSDCEVQEKVIEMADEERTDRPG